MTGKLGKETVRRYVKRRADKLHDCYEKALATKPTLAGTVIAQFTISSAGLVTHAAASGMNDANVEACIAGALEEVEFPKPTSGEAVVRYPLECHPAPPAEERRGFAELVGTAALRELFLVLTRDGHD